ncbi:hypothetical protein KV557_03230 [Kitasatospora aureofaciens]|uniref:hypothetical protein n=1 Tax=Kitasatospora aureofaciens TaxID=1894 RepID=UPI001C46C72A|nr:hypothetical protein [Kitasatospora aureofaciens]MBV6696137.1 hypothetical protein [Kitasatospora aureofaciens]
MNGRPLFGGTLREINSGARIHYDEAVREVPGLFDQHRIAQLAFNTWFLAPESGGETRLWRRRWQPEDEQHRISYGFDLVTRSISSPEFAHYELPVAA